MEIEIIIMYIEKIENYNESLLILDDSKIKMALGSRVLESYIDGNLFLDRYSCVNRVVCGEFNGLGNFSYISRANIGRYCNMGARISVGGFQHPLDWLSISSVQFRSDAFFEGASPAIDYLDNDNIVTEINNDVWIGDNVVIKSGVTLSTGCVVGAGSVVTKDVAPYEIVVGNPAKILRRRFDDGVIGDLLDLEWWTLSPIELSNVSFNEVEIAIDQIKEIKSNCS